MKLQHTIIATALACIALAQPVAAKTYGKTTAVLDYSCVYSTDFGSVTCTFSGPGLTKMLGEAVAMELSSMEPSNSEPAYKMMGLNTAEMKRTQCYYNGRATMNFSSYKVEEGEGGWWVPFTLASATVTKNPTIQPKSPYDGSLDSNCNPARGKK